MSWLSDCVADNRAARRDCADGRHRGKTPNLPTLAASNSPRGWHALPAPGAQDAEVHGTRRHRSVLLDRGGARMAFEDQPCLRRFTATTLFDAVLSAEPDETRLSASVAPRSAQVGQRRSVEERPVLPLHQQPGTPSPRAQDCPPELHQRLIACHAPTAGRGVARAKTKYANFPGAPGIAPQALRRLQRQA